MANYECRARTNYFRVLDERKFRERCRRYEFDVITHGEGPARLFSISLDDDKTLPTSSFDEQSGQEVEADPLRELADHVAPGYVAIYIEVGYEKLTYVNGFAWAINSRGETAQVHLSEIIECKVCLTVTLIASDNERPEANNLPKKRICNAARVSPSKF